MMKRAAICCCFVLAAGCCPAAAGDAVAVAVSAFQTFCMGSPFEFSELVRASAKLNGKLAEEVHPSLPAGSALHIKRWNARVDGVDLNLGAVDATEDGKLLRICSVFLAGPKGANPRDLLVKSLSLGAPVKDGIGAKDGAHSVVWEKQIDGKASRIDLNLEQKSTHAVIVLNRVQPSNAKQ